MGQLQKASKQLENRHSAGRAWLRALELTAPLAESPIRIFSVVLEELAEQFRDKSALLSDHEEFTYHRLGLQANRYARWALAHGVGKGDVVCLLMPNRPEYLAIWIGVTSIGGIVSLLNTALSGLSLAHCINIASPRHVILGSELEERFITARPHLTVRPKVWRYGNGPSELSRIDLEVSELSGRKLEIDQRQPVTVEDCALYIYTSGTTGLPKATKVSHYRILQWSYWFAGMMDTQPSDRIYNCLPMYHSVGGVVATGAVLVSGGSIVLREKFSAHRFWDEITAWDCTLFQYIGELCRYLVHAPIHPREAEHNLRLCCGNGLRSDIWLEFKTRFRIPQILEFYAATESNVSLYNVEGLPGSIGRVPPFLAHRWPVALVKFDVEKAEPSRDEKGLCIRCTINEVGEALGRIEVRSGRSGIEFDGYTDRAGSTKKILRDVFQPGDAWFRTGDLMRRDQNGYFYFIDRVGDTFRWKGENVSTTEVANTVMAFPGVVEAVVFGVRIPGTEGRAGMAALVINEHFDLTALSAFLQAQLPAYAHPVFLRICSTIEATATFKQIKVNFIAQGYHPGMIEDVIYVKSRGLKEFVRLDAALYGSIQNGVVQF
jgi:fatty-acyl-CoA synthase